MLKIKPWGRMDGAPTGEILEVTDKCSVDTLIWKYNDDERTRRSERIIQITLGTVAGIC
ncbi:MAG TPA: hypothetical protein VMW76_10250 [Bacteroidales bacterium]|nr:hypothetical protein [Bacteroidales bacterium]